MDPFDKAVLQGLACLFVWCTVVIGLVLVWVVRG